MASAYVPNSEARANDEKLFKEFDEWLAKTQPKVYQPLRLTYMAYAKSVWVLGLYEKVPPLIKKIEPVPYKDKETIMVALDRLMDNPPPFIKEYFIKHDEEQERELYSHMQKHKYTPYAKIPRIPADCSICFIKKDYPHIEKHFPKPFPDTDCRYLKIKNYHFKNYQQVTDTEKD